MSTLSPITVDHGGVTHGWRNAGAQHADRMMARCSALLETIGERLAQAEKRNADGEMYRTADIRPLLDALIEADAVGEMVL